jgi:hypothetical protein
MCIVFEVVKVARNKDKTGGMVSKLTKQRSLTVIIINKLVVMP